MSSPPSLPGSASWRTIALPRPDLDDRRLRLGTKAVVGTDESILLVREGRSDGSRFWTLPGGGLRGSESFKAGLRREIDEELRCGVEIDKPVGLCLYEHRSRPGLVTMYAVYAGSLTGDVRPNLEEGILGYQWSTPPLPEDTLEPIKRLIESA